MTSRLYDKNVSEMTAETTELLPERVSWRRSSLADVMGGQWTDEGAEAVTDAKTSVCGGKSSSPRVI